MTKPSGAVVIDVCPLVAPGEFARDPPCVVDDFAFVPTREPEVPHALMLAAMSAAIAVTNPVEAFR